MAREARIVIPGLPHHVTQRGNRRLPVFFSDADYESYRALLAEFCGRAGTAVWAYCLMPNHVHLILVPDNADGLRASLGEAHRRYTRRINRREDWRGHLWQERFHSFPMDEAWLLACARYVVLNPVRAGLVKDAADWPWSSAGAHLTGQDDDLVTVAGLAERVGDWRAFLEQSLEEVALDRLRRHGMNGRALGGAAFMAEWEAKLGRPLGPRPRGRPKQR